MGIVFGDIGTSPLYAFKEAAKAASLGEVVSSAAVLGIVSLIFWSLIVVISVKYAILIMRADNHCEGGILALLALISPRRARQSRRRAIMVTVGLVGAALLYGDGAITPAISVLSAAWWRAPDIPPRLGSRHGEEPSPSSARTRSPSASRARTALPL